MAQDSRLIQAVYQEARKYLADEAWQQGMWRDRDAPVPYKHPPWRWYEEKIKQFTLPSRGELIQQGDIHTKKQGPFYGEMNMFFYDAKFKKTLPYWDRFPLVIPILDRTLNFNSKAEFIGINFHYLSIPLRIALLNQLVKLYISNTVFDEDGLESFNNKTRLLITNFSQLVLTADEAIPCMKHYLSPHIKSNIRRIKASEFIISMLLPIEDFHSQRLGSGGSIESRKVWRNSARGIQRK